jgi:CDP-glucose 4,6-dehydratase
MKSKLIKKVLITGHKGFIGIWVSSMFSRLGWKVYGVDNNSSKGDRLYNKIKIKFEKEINCSIEDEKKILNFIKKTKPSLLINIAGQAIVPRAFKEPKETFSSNTIGTLTLLELLKKTRSIKSGIFITSDKVYKNIDKDRIFKESDQLEGKDIYSSSKVFADNLVKIYSNDYLNNKKINLQIIRLGNVVGGGDWSINRLIPDLVHAAVGKKIFKARYKKATRPFQYISDTVEGIFKISMASLNNKIKSGDCWNLGPKNNSYARVGDVINIFKKTWKKLIIREEKERFKEDLNLRIDVNKYCKKFGSPKYTSKESVVKTIKWYHNYYQQKITIKNLMKDDFNFVKKIKL